MCVAHCVCVCVSKTLEVGGVERLFYQLILVFNFFTFYRELLEKELESVGIRLNRTKPNIYFKVKKFCYHQLLISKTYGF